MYTEVDTEVDTEVEVEVETEAETEAELVIFALVIVTDEKKAVEFEAVFVVAKEFDYS